MGMIIEFYACDDTTIHEHDEQEVSVYTLRDQCKLIGDISINSSVAAETLSSLGNTMIAKLVEVDSPTAILIPSEDIKSLVIEIEAIKDSGPNNQLAEAITDATEEIIWHRQSMGIVVA